MIDRWASPGPHWAVKNPPVMQEPQETWIRSPGQEDLLEEGMATHSSILIWRIPWTEEPGRLQSIGWQRVGHNWNDLEISEKSESAYNLSEAWHEASKQYKNQSL